MLPKAETFHFRARVAERGVAVRVPIQVQVEQFLQVGTNNLVSIHKDNLLEGEGEEDVEEKDFVAPNDALLFSLWVELIVIKGISICEQIKLMEPFLVHVLTQRGQ